jgi:pyruvate/2-oxoglutarate dehydrogenase complex dihydrolipoamide dehydrogenase (E3) component
MIKLVYDGATHRILGAQAWGKKNAAARINAIAVAVAAGMTTEQLSSVGFVYSSSASSIWDPIQIVCSEACK